MLYFLKERDASECASTAADDHFFIPSTSRFHTPVTLQKIQLPKITLQLFSCYQVNNRNLRKAKQSYSTKEQDSN
ncbi:hypothetical protein BPOR_0170g00060 [Botrytis porri]|uniref:Uncharacterized protein n=1 Tax=Botrytis porri TaxID=87229 RepID=A0A4Z1KUU8_9HELO|nr:hypothetical protein BPOR_0170g00060 [Botrytis porri]